MPHIIRCLEDYPLDIPGRAKLISAVEADYQDFINKPIIALVKPAEELGALAAENVLAIINKTTKSNCRNAILPLELKLDKAYLRVGFEKTESITS